MDFWEMLYAKQFGSGGGAVVIEGAITCVDDGNGNVTITEDE